MEEPKTVEWQVLLEKITLEAPSSLLQEVKNAPGLREKVEICYNSQSINAALSDWLMSCITRPSGFKDTELAIKYRQAGNRYCEEKNYALALKYFNKSLLYSSSDSDELRSAFGNRSHVLLLMDRFKESIKDIDRALINGSSDLRQIKLTMRKGEALLALKKYPEATKALLDAANMIRSQNDNNKKKTLKTLQQVEKLLEIVNDEVKRAETSGSISGIENDFQNYYKVLKEPSLDFKENPNFRFASRAISLQKNEEKGRFVVANKNIKVGDVLFAERPFAFVVLPDMIDKYCSFCCKRIFDPVPCLTCPLACFCDENCREEAWEKFHSWECGGLEVCFSVGIVHLSLRVALLGLLEENCDKYLEVKNLVSHLSDLQPSDLFSYSVTATLLILYLETYSNLFQGENKRDKLLDFGGAVLLHIGQLVCNGHAITDIESEERGQSLLVEDQVRVATAIYPSASMMNHSCEPNIINSFYNTLLIVRATKNLKKGDEVYNCYGPMAYNTEYKERQEQLLSQYFFVCDCNACRKKEEPVTDRFVCKYCSSKIRIDTTSCSNCSKPINMVDLIKDLEDSDISFKRGVAELENGQFEESCKYFHKALLLREKHCHKNHRKLLECRDFLARAYASLGKEEEAYWHIIKNIQAIEGIYGEISIELGQEIMKLLSLGTSICDKEEKMTPKQRKILEESLILGKKGQFIFTLSYGEWHPRYNELKRHLDYINFFLDM